MTRGEEKRASILRSWQCTWRLVLGFLSTSSYKTKRRRRTTITWFIEAPRRWWRDYSTNYRLGKWSSRKKKRKRKETIKGNVCDLGGCPTIEQDLAGNGIWYGLRCGRCISRGGRRKFPRALTNSHNPRDIKNKFSTRFLHIINPSSIQYIYVLFRAFGPCFSIPFL